MNACAEAVSMLTATAPATLTGPLEVEPWSLVAPPVPVLSWSFSVAFLSPNPICLLVSLSTDWLSSPS